RAGRTQQREPIPEEESKLIVSVMTELPWMPKDATPRTPGEVAPSRQSLWFMVQQDMTGFKQPMFPPVKPGDPPVDGNKIWEDATSVYLKANADKIKIKGFVK